MGCYTACLAIAIAIAIGDYDGDMASADGVSTGPTHGRVFSTHQVGTMVRGEGLWPTDRTVSDWSKKQYVKSSVAPPRGRRHAVLWSIEDVICARSFAALVFPRCNMTVLGAWVAQNVRPAIIGPQSPTLRAGLLDGEPVLLADDATSLGRDVRLPLGEWFQMACAWTEPLPEPPNQQLPLF